MWWVDGVGMEGGVRRDGGMWWVDGMVMEGGVGRGDVVGDGMVMEGGVGRGDVVGRWDGDGGRGGEG